MEKKTTRSERMALSYFPAYFNGVSIERGMWYETEEDQQHMLDWGRRKAILLHWVRSQMILVLTERQQQVIEHIYFKGLSHKESGDLLGVSASTSCRDGQKAIKRLREAAQEDRSWEATWYGRTFRE